MPNAQPLQMPDVFKYFWFFGAAFTALNLFLWRRHLLVAVDRGKATRAEVDSFVRWTGLWLVGGPIALAISQIAGGWTSPFCAFDAPTNSVPLLTMEIGGAAGAVALLHWVWRGTGADFLARVAPAFQRRPDYDNVYPSSYVRTYVTFAVIVCLLSPLVWRMMAPSPVPFACPISHGTGR